MEGVFILNLPLRNLTKEEKERFGLSECTDLSVRYIVNTILEGGHILDSFTAKRLVLEANNGNCNKWYDIEFWVRGRGYGYFIDKGITNIMEVIECLPDATVANVSSSEELVNVIKNLTGYEEVIYGKF